VYFGIDEIVDESVLYVLAERLVLIWETVMVE